MFGYLRKKVLCSKRITNATKKLLYESYVLSILLFDSELWRLNAASLAKLESFHRGNVRAMARTTTTYITWKNHTRAFEPVGLRGIKSYIAYVTHYAGWATLHGCPSTSCIEDF